VQVFQHRRGIDPTTPSFEQALDKIDQSVAYLTQHVGSTCPVLEARWWVLTDL
jgi:hypothetical protein